MPRNEGQLRAAGFSLFTVSTEEWVPGESTVTANKSFSLTVDGLDKKGEGCCERKLKEKKECERQVLLSSSWPV